MVDRHILRLKKLAHYGLCCLRVLVARETSARWSTVWGYLKLHWLTWVQPERTRPVRLVGWQVSFGSLRALRQVYREVFIERVYAHFAPSQAQLILDVGANIGIAMLWYAKHYPEARIVCFEPNPPTYALLEENVSNNQLHLVTTHRLAVGADEGTRRFYFDGSSPAGELTHTVSEDFRSGVGDEPEMASHFLPIEPLNKYLVEPVDILKIDIEGSEGAVVDACSEDLTRVRVVQMEYHSVADNPLQPLLRALERGGHAYEVNGGRVLAGAADVAMVYSRNRRSVPWP